MPAPAVVSAATVATRAMVGPAGMVVAVESAALRRTGSAEALALAAMRATVAPPGWPETVGPARPEQHPTSTGAMAASVATPVAVAAPVPPAPDRNRVRQGRPAAHKQVSKVTAVPVVRALMPRSQVNPVAPVVPGVLGAITATAELAVPVDQVQREQMGPRAVLRWSTVAMAPLGAVEVSAASVARADRSLAMVVPAVWVVSVVRVAVVVRA